MVMINVIFGLGLERLWHSPELTLTLFYSV